MQGGYGSSASNLGRTGSSGTSAKPGSSSGSSTNKYLNIGLAILAVVILLFLIGSYYNHKKQNGREKFESFPNELVNPVETTFTPGPIDERVIVTDNVRPQSGMGQNEVFETVVTNVEQPGNKFGLHGNQYPTDCYPKDTLTAAELLPSDANSKWAQVNPAGQGELGDQNFLEAGFHIGTNTIGQTLRNPNLQLRSEPSNPQVKVSPWMQTTIEPDSNRRGLEIGGC